MSAPDRRIFLIGLMGAGKSTVGRRLAIQTGWPYVDNDELIQRFSGRTAPEIVAAEGEDGLHALELEAFEVGARLPEPVIVGVAGFVVTDEEARAMMRSAGRIVWLRATPARWSSAIRIRRSWKQ